MSKWGKAAKMLTKHECKRGLWNNPRTLTSSSSFRVLLNKLQRTSVYIFWNIIGNCLVLRRFPDKRTHGMLNRACPPTSAVGVGALNCKLQAI